MSAPDIKGISVEENVFKPLKWSYDSLTDDITRSCFLCVACIQRTLKFWWRNLCSIVTVKGYFMNA
ncbi:disease resistance protein-like [Dorcoceras hygrometricum]|nr:disease resistance protein-like [Dorcoceras hygrometricum]